jgi:hypothetical protein
MKQYEYLIIPTERLTPPQQQMALNQVGIFGWELVQIYNDIIYLKREKINPPVQTSTHA